MGKVELYPIKGAKVRDILNRGGASVGNIVSSYFSGEINDSSKRKPIRLEATSCQDYDASAPNYMPEWWKGNGFCGYNVDAAIAESWTELRDCYDGDSNGWVYERPTGGDYPLRLGDFGGYNANALPLSYGFLAPEVVYKKQTSATIAINLPSQNEDSITWHDFEGFDNHYFGVLVYSSGNYRRVTAEETIGNGGSLITFNPSLLTAGRTYTIYPFISSVPYTESESDKAMTLYTLPHVEPTMMTVKQSSIRVVPMARKENATETIIWEVMVYNDTADAVTLTDGSLRIFKDKNTAAVVGDYSTTIPTTTIAANANMEVASGVATVGYRDRDYNFVTTMLYVEVSFNKGTYFATGMVAEDLSGGGGIT